MTTQTDVSRGTGATSQRKPGSKEPQEPRQTFTDETTRRGLFSRRARAAAERRAQGLGWVSVGLGLAQLAAPRRVAELVGVAPTDRNRNTILALGLRELAAGLTLLTRPRPARWMWARLVGDVVDMALLGRAYPQRTSAGRWAAVSAAVAGKTTVDALTAAQLAAGDVYGRRFTESITVRRPIDEVYRFWRDLSNLPRFVAQLETVEELEGGRSRWVARAPNGRQIEWEAYILEDHPNERITWRSAEDAGVPTTGHVSFARAPGTDGTEVRVEMHYDPPGGALGVGLAKLMGREPRRQVRADLLRLKQVLETGEVVHSDASFQTTPSAAWPSPSQGAEGGAS